MSDKISSVKSVKIELAKDNVTLWLIRAGRGEGHKYADISDQPDPVKYAFDTAAQLVGRPLSIPHPTERDICIGFMVTAQLIVKANNEVLRGALRHLQYASFFGKVRPSTEQELQRDGYYQHPTRLVLPDNKCYKLYNGDQVYDIATRGLIHTEDRAFSYE